MAIPRKQLGPDVSLGATKTPCVAATVANHGLTGLTAFDGVTPVAGDRILVKAQSTPAQNGIYVAAAGAWARAADFDVSADADPGTFVPVSEGTANGGTAWQLTTAGPITLDTTGLTFEVIGRAGSDPGAHGTDHNPGGSDPVTTAIAVGLDADTANAEGAATSLARSNHTHALATAGGVISTVNAGDAGVEGSGAGVARRDHQHAVATGAATAQIDIGDTAAEGASSNLAREDHAHALPAPAAPVNVTKSAASAGAATTVARSDHKHDVTTAAPVAVGTANAEGTAVEVARADHVHSHGNQAGGALHADATISVAGFMSALDKTKLDTLQNAAGIDAKESVRLRTQADDTLSGLAVRDGVTPLVGDRVLVDQQTTVTQDGIYIAASGAWARSADAPVASEARGWIVHIEEGTADGDKLFQCTNNAGSDVVGTDGLTFAQIGAGSPRGAGAGLVLNGNDLDVVALDGSIVVAADSIVVGVLQTDAMHGVRGGGTQHADAVAAGAAGFMTGADKTKLDGIATGANVNTTHAQERVTTENINGTDTAITDTLNNTPTSNASVLLLFNGVAMIQGAGEDYTISGATITWLASSGTAQNMDTGDDLVAMYEF